MCKFFTPLLTVVLLALSPLALAQSQPQLLSEHLPEDCYHSGHYHQSERVAGLPKPLITTGSFVFDCHHGLIWHTQTPIVETIIYRRSGDALLIAQQGEQTRLEGRLHKSIGTLLNNLIGGNSDYLVKNFTLQSASNGVTLTPKKRRLQKFLQQVNLQHRGEEVTLSLHFSAEESTSVAISAKKTYAELDEQACVAIATIPPKSCRALYDK